MKTFLQVPFVVALSLFAVSCSSTRTGASVKSSNSAKVLTIDEYNKFAQEIVGAISGRIIRFNTSESKQLGPVILAIGDFKDKTSQYSANFANSKDVMYGQIREVLINQGLASVNMDMAGSGGEVDSLLASINSLRASGEYNQSTVAGPGKRLAPELILWGDIISIKFKDGRKTNYQYALNVRLLSVETGASIFEKQVQLPKQFIRGWFGA